MRLPVQVACLALASLALCFSAELSARNRFVVFPEGGESLPALHYAGLHPEGCISELQGRAIGFTRVHGPSTVDTPVSFDGQLHGVRFEFANLAPSGDPVEASRKQVLDCRLLLALDDLAKFSAERQIEAVRYNSIYRRGPARAFGQRHLAGVAIDIVEFVKRDGSVLNVAHDFAGNGIGSATCGEKARPAKPGKPQELRQLVCDLDRARFFNLLLTPHYDYRHRDHFHFEVRRGIRWFLTQ